jgi:hypothetical protein
MEFLIFGLCLCLAIAADRAVHKAVDHVRGEYRARKERYLARGDNHPHRVASALGAFARGVPGAASAVRTGWSEGWAEGRQRYENRGAPAKEEAPAPRRRPRPSPAAEPAPAPAPAPTPAPAPPSEQPAAAPAPTPAPPTPKPAPPVTILPVHAPHLRLVPNTGGDSMSIEINTVADVRRAVHAHRDRATGELEAAQTALTRATADNAAAISLQEQAKTVLDKDANARAALASLTEATTSDMRYCAAKVTAAEAKLASCNAALAALARHTALEEGVASTPEASSQTSAYAPQ